MSDKGCRVPFFLKHPAASAWIFLMGLLLCARSPCQCLTIGVVSCSQEAPIMSLPSQSLAKITQHLSSRGHSLKHFTTLLTVHVQWWLHEQALDMDMIDIVLACGQAGLDVYDYAEAADVPYVKFSADKDPTWLSAPLLEFPNLVITEGQDPLPACFAAVPYVQLPSTVEGLQRVTEAIVCLAKTGTGARQCGIRSYNHMVSCCSSLCHFCMLPTYHDNGTCPSLLPTLHYDYGICPSLLQPFLHISKKGHFLSNIKGKSLFLMSSIALMLLVQHSRKQQHAEGSGHACHIKRLEGFESQCY